jgi:hypothetical protein
VREGDDGEGKVMKGVREHKVTLELLEVLSKALPRGTAAGLKDQTRHLRQRSVKEGRRRQVPPRLQIVCNREQFA